MDNYTLALLTQIKTSITLRERYTQGSRRWSELTGEIEGLSRAVYFYTGILAADLMREHNRLMERPTVPQEERHERSA